MRMFFVGILLLGLKLGCADAPQNPQRFAAWMIRAPGDILMLSVSTKNQEILNSSVALVPDSKLVYDVESVLLGEFFRDAKISVRAHEQRLVLSGSAPSGAQAEAAERAALQVKGVASVTNNIRIP